MTAARPIVDPDIRDAIRDMIPMARQMRIATEKLKELGPSGDLNKVASWKQQWASAKADICTRADRIGVDREVLLLIVGVVSDLKGKSRRRPDDSAVRAMLGTKLAERERELQHARERAMTAHTAYRAFAPVAEARAA